MRCCCFVGCCFQDLLKIVHSNPVSFLSDFFSMYFVCIHVVHPYSNIDTATTWKKHIFFSSSWSDLHIVYNLSIAFHSSAKRILTSLSVDEMLLLRYVNFRVLSLRLEMAPFCLKHIYVNSHSHRRQCLLLLFALRLCTRVSVWADVFAWSVMSSV